MISWDILQDSLEVPSAGAPDGEHDPDRDAQLGGGLQVGGVRQAGGIAARTHILHLGGNSIDFENIWSKLGPTV